MKTCAKCTQTKPLDDFYNFKKNSDGKQQYCKECQKAISKAYAAYRKALDKQVEVNSKVCLDCGLEKPSSQFGKKSFNLDKLNDYCKPCWSVRIKAAKRRMYAKAQTL
jgi:hypothetical protein